VTRPGRSGPCRSIRAGFCLLGLLGLFTLVGSVVAAPVAGEVPPSRTYRPPVDAPVLDPFRNPAHPWEPGTRGIEYATIAGTPIRAIGPGRVVFAGPVAGALHVTVLHPDGLRSSYSFLAAIRVADGDAVAGGQVVGISGDRFHVGVRRGDAYLDPAQLWGTPVGGGRVRLVPTDAPDRGGPDDRAPPSGAEATLAARTVADAVATLGTAGRAAREESVGGPGTRRWDRSGGLGPPRRGRLGFPLGPQQGGS
jgi:hypothetical protein